MAYAYNPTTDRLQSITRNNTTYTLAYDTFGNVTSTKVGNQTLATYSYGAANGDLISSTYGNGAQVSYTYDAYHRPTSVQWQGDSPSTVVYDARGDVFKSTDGITGVTTTYEYDLIGRPFAVSSSDGLKQWVGYDTYGHTSSVNWSQGSVSQKMTYTYNNANLKDLLTNVSAIGTTPTSSFAPAYDAIGNPTSWRSSMSMCWVRGRRLSTISALGQAYSYTYDAWGRPLSITGSQASTIGVQNPLTTTPKPASTT